MNVSAINTDIMIVCILNPIYSLPFFFLIFNVSCSPHADYFCKCSALYFDGETPNLFLNT